MASITTRVTNASVAGVGTITCNAGSPTVTGVGTSFLSSVFIGQQLTNSSSNFIGTVLTVDSNTQITLVSNAALAATAEAYNIVSTGITTKGSPLSNAEIDANFVNLNNAVVAGANSSVNNVANTLVKRGPAGEFSAGAATLAAGTSVGGTAVPSSNASQAQMEAGTDTTTRYMSPNSIKQAIDVLAMQTVGSVTKDMTGFESLSGSSISYVDATRVFTLAPSGTTAVSKTFSVTASGGKFYIDGVMQATLELLEGGTYTFDQSDASNTGHPLRFSTTSNGTHGGGVEYTTNVTVSGTPGSAGAYTRIIVPSSAPTLYYYCVNHSGMGGQLNTIQGYYVWFRGKKTLMTTSLTTTLPATPGNHYIGINPTTLTLETFTTADTIFIDTILVASIYLDTATTKAIIVGDERHSSARDTTWHINAHNNFGAIWRSGGALTYTLNSDSAVNLSFATPIYLADEDLVHSIVHASSPSGYYQQVLNGSANLQTLYLNGTTYSIKQESTLPWVAGSSTAAINTITSGSGSLLDAGEGKFLNYWIVATNDKISPIKAIMGRVSYSTLTECFNEQFQDYGLPFLEFAPMYKVTLQTSGSYTGNASKVRIVNVRTVTQRQSAINQTFKEPAHSELSNLGSDDHSQYVHISVARTISAAHTFSGNNSFQGTQGFNNITVSGIGSHMVPTATSTYDLGSTTMAWRNIYTSDLHMSNENHEEGNVVDGTRGNWTVQEGEEHLYLLNNKNGKRYKFKIEEV
jgi:hypothetical protein